MTPDACGPDPCRAPAKMLVSQTAERRVCMSAAPPLRTSSRSPCAHGTASGPRPPRAPPPSKTRAACETRPGSSPDKNAACSATPKARGLSQHVGMTQRRQRRLEASPAHGSARPRKGSAPARARSGSQPTWSTSCCRGQAAEQAPAKESKCNHQRLNEKHLAK